METPQEFCKRKGFTQEPPGTTSYYIMWSMMRMYARYYHEQQVKSVDLADVGGSLPTCTLLEREDVMFGKYKLTSCCKQGPVTQENYCPNCGAKIERQ